MNLKNLIHDKGYEITRFAKEELDCTYQTFNWRLRNGHFLLKDIVICMDILDTTLEELLVEVKIPSRKTLVRNKDMEVLDFSRLDKLLKQ